ncbi:MAG: amidohydrolase [Planctomycetes bacterium]|nr:amidohydrolase [Planctomycetota bacterium]
MNFVPPSVFARMVDLRRDLHRHPELSWEEERTATRIAAELERLGLSVRRVAGTGLIADLPGAAPGPIVALRADTDALPVHEQTGLTFASEREGVMHACGHDGHSSMLLGAAELLLAGPPPPCPVRLLWQPAEERGAGAVALIEAGALEGVELIFGGHLDRRFPAGTLIVSEGPVNASTDTFRVEITGQQGHGARPHETLDAVVAGSLLVTSLQTVVSREVNPAHPSVLTVGTFQAGTAGNVIAGQALLEGTIRAQDPEVRQHLIASLKRIGQAIGMLHGAKVEVSVKDGTPPVINPPGATAIARRAALEVTDPELVVPLPNANMGGEDFAYYLERVAGCYIRYGGLVPGRESFPAHSSQFDFDEAALGCGAAWLARVAVLGGEHLRGAGTP